MSGHKPFVVVVAGVSEKIGKSTIANNLAVYLKALREDIPVTLLSFETGPAIDAMFSLGDNPAPTVADLHAEGDLRRLSRMGQYGVCYLSAREQPLQVDDRSWLRRIVSRDDQGGLVIVDAGNHQDGLWQSAVWAADLVLAPIGEHRSLSRLGGLRRELVEGGGQTEMLWLLPSHLGEVTGNAAGVDDHQLLRFAAGERGCQVLKSSLSEDQRVHLQASGLDRAVLTRLPGSYVHDELRQLAEFVLRKYADGPDVDCQSRRMIADGLLPRRARRVDLACPLCARSAIGTRVHYLEAMPTRYRVILHADCLDSLLRDTGIRDFLPVRNVLLIETGVEGGGLRSHLRLLPAWAEEGFAEQDLLRPEQNSGWDALLRTVTGRSLNEQIPGLLIISAVGEARSLLDPGQHHMYQRQKRSFLSRFRAEEF